MSETIRAYSKGYCGRQSHSTLILFWGRSWFAAHVKLAINPTNAVPVSLPSLKGEQPAKHGGQPQPKRPRERFYRPELDALRFFAFFAVFIHHGPYPHGPARLIFFAGRFGLSIFFLLSAYLITELLLRELDKAGTVVWRLFFIRRALRIWPLYFAAIGASVLLGHYVPRFRLSGAGVAVYSLFVRNWIPGRMGGLSLLGPLWSISIEEQFYLIWPPVIKAGGRKLVKAVSLFFIALAFASIFFLPANNDGWLTTQVEFLFFAAGAMIALGTHNRPLPRLSMATRVMLLIAGVIFVLAGDIPLDIRPGGAHAHAMLAVTYAAAVFGCVLIFLGVLGVSRIPRPLAHLGRISYGLYVFHSVIFVVAVYLLRPFGVTDSYNRFSLYNAHTAFSVLIVDSAALVLCIIAAHLSYQYFEKPFLKLKNRFEVVPSRPA